jgi:hypothetical protein
MNPDVTPAIIFRYNGHDSTQWSETYRVGTDDEKLSMVNTLLTIFESEVKIGDVLGAVHAKKTQVRTNNNYVPGIWFFRRMEPSDLPQNGRATFILDDEGENLSDEEEVDTSAVFLVGSMQEKLKFANWVAQDKMGAFGEDSSELDISKSFLVAADTKVTRRELKNTRERQKSTVLQACEDLFEVKEQLSDAAFCRINNALKRSFESI